MQTITIGPVPTKNGKGVVVIFHSDEKETAVTVTLDMARTIAMQLLVLADTLEKGKE
jgi:ATP-dependent Clp protease adapter protein ClpS